MATFTKEREREYQKIWMRNKRASSADFRKKESVKTREWQKRNPEKNAWNQYKVSAKKRGIEFLLNEKEFQYLIFGNCNYCGFSPDPVNGVDRVNNNIGYIKENCVSCCSICNQAKHTLPIQEFKEWIVRIYKHLTSIK